MKHDTRIRMYLLQDNKRQTVDNGFTDYSLLSFYLPNRLNVRILIHQLINDILIKTAFAKAKHVHLKTLDFHF